MESSQPIQLGSLSHDQTRQNYFDAIEYQLRFLVDFVRKEENEQSIFILIGDHQPPRVARKADGFETPIHIISKDVDFINSFAEYGFGEGLRVQDNVEMVKHESIYSMLMRALVANYGEDPTILPPYLPGGLLFNQENKSAAAD